MNIEMNKIILSILIPTVNGREGECANLGNYCIKQFENLGQKWIYANQVNPQIEAFRTTYTECEIVTYKDDKTITIGEKREWLYQKAKCTYSWMIDDDDSISANAIQLILEAIKNNPGVDCITFEEAINIDGKIEKSNHSLTYGDWEGQGGGELWDGFHYHRTPFFKSVIKTEIARSVPIPHIRFGEDHQWAQALKPHLKSEIHINQEIYKYIHISSPHNLRYGINGD